ncbi:MAG: histidinol-phosphatase HisJ family protein [Clostridia bacterium]|nr:histidinol-phosphatase HisJ family protein [Clostridia bacterium]
MLLCDCHNHTWFSFDAKGNIDEMCRGAASAGVGIFALTEHYDYDDRGGERYYGARHARRMAEMKRAKQEWADRLELLCGIEIGQPHLDPARSRRLAAEGGFDLVIGSLHDLRPGREIYRGFDYSSLEVCDAVYAQFFHEAEEMLETCDFDVFGHFDYPLRMMEKSVPAGSMIRWKERMLPFLKALAQSGRALEINTSGVRRWQGRPGGETWLLDAYRQFGGRRISVGSDAHRGREVGIGIQEAYRQLLQSGFDSVTVYRGRRPEQISIR